MNRVGELSKLGDWMVANFNEDVATTAFHKNRWFEKKNIKIAWDAWANLLNEQNLLKWVEPYSIEKKNANDIGIVMAGNIPLVGMHDLISVLITDNKALVKLSSDDEVLFKYILKGLELVSPQLYNQVQIVERLADFDAVIATGSNNSKRYFQHYFGKYPNILRGSRTSCAVLTGKETADELELLTDDIFLYYGLGCRNISKIYVPKNYEIINLFPVFDKYDDLLANNKYKNNYDYIKSIYLVNGDDFYDNGFTILKESNELFSPVSVTFYETYENENVIKMLAESLKEDIQCIVSNLDIPGAVPFGKAQFPELNDYADNVDTLEFLTKL